MKWVVRSDGREHEVEVERTPRGLHVTVDGEPREVDLLRLDGSVASLRFLDDSTSYTVAYQRENRVSWRLALLETSLTLEVMTPVEATELGGGAGAGGGGRVEAPIPGKVVAVKVAEGDRVEPGQPLVVLEAMKMENELAAEREGVVSRVHVEAGMAVEAGMILVELE